MSRAQKHGQLFIRASEYQDAFGGFKQKSQSIPFQKLPFDHCALSFQLIPEGQAMCAINNNTNTNSFLEGTLFDIVNIVPFLQKHHKHPVTGDALEIKDLIKVKFHYDHEGKIHCPITFKTFNNNSHIALIKSSGNVYSFEAIDKMILQLNNWRDLIDDSISITRKDVIILQDPQKVQSKQVADFYFLKQHLSIPKAEEIENKQEEESEILYSSHASDVHTKSTALTSSSVPIKTKNTTTNIATEEKKEKTEEQKREELYPFLKKKGKSALVRLKTNFGDVNLELFAHLVPKTCDNFLQLAEKGYYNNVTFHRLVKGFMIQGGDPTGTGRGGESIWKKPFADEFHPKLKHTERGILSMANRGPNTNTSQFFITFKEASHLDNKHTIFGKVVGGMEVINKLEQIPTEKEKPLQSIIIEEVKIFSNPFKEVEKEAKLWQEKKRKRDEYVAAVQSSSKEPSGKWYSQPLPSETVHSSTTVGKYISQHQPTILKEEEESYEPVSKKTKSVKEQFDFTGWK